MPRPGRGAWRSLRLPALALALLLLAVTGHTAVVTQQAAVLSPATRTPPVTLSALPLTGTTVTGQTVATTNGLVPLLGATSTLNVARGGPQAWEVRVAVTSASGITGSETLAVAIVGGSTQSVSLGSGTPYPQSSGAVALGAGGITVTVATLNVLAGCHSCTVHAELRVAPQGSLQPAFVYPYTVTTNP